MGAQTHKQALAGLFMLQGDSQKEALVKAGYSPATAHNATANGLGVDRCIDRAVEKFPTVDPSHLVEQARRVIGRKLDRLAAADVKEIDATPPREIARIFEVVEKAHGHRSDGSTRDIDPRTFAERMLWLQQVKEEFERLSGVSMGETPGKLEASDSDSEKG